MSFLFLIRWDEFNLIEFIASLVVTIILTIIIYYLKPRVRINCACYDSNINVIKINVENNGYFDAVNLRLEACAFNKDSRQTIHLKLEQFEFLILPNKKSEDNSKIFKIISVEDFSQQYGSYEEIIENIRNNNWQLRIRLHSYHSFSGFGKAEERILKVTCNQSF